QKCATNIGLIVAANCRSLAGSTDCRLLPFAPDEFPPPWQPKCSATLRSVSLLSNPQIDCSNANPSPNFPHWLQIPPPPSSRFVNRQRSVPPHFGQGPCRPVR